MALEYFFHRWTEDAPVLDMSCSWYTWHSWDVLRDIGANWSTDWWLTYAFVL